MNSKPIADMRISYDLATFGDEDAVANPLEQFRAWWDEVADTNIMEANAMSITTVSADGIPQSRMVLMKDFSSDGLVFYTNYNSAKAQAIAANNNVCALFYWPSLERQVRFTGIASRVSAEESDAYFRIRPRGSQLGAWASPQSEPIARAGELRDRFETVEQQFSGQAEIPRPEGWGGFCVRPVSIEFWQGRRNRLHDRILYTLDDQHEWHACRLAP